MSESLPEPRRNAVLARVESGIEWVLFASRWLLAPFYVALVVGLLALLIKAAQHVVEIILHVATATESALILDLLGLIDLTLTGSLIIIVIFSGYENFVSRIDVSKHTQWPEWMAKIDFTGLKLKLLSSIVAISAIQLLRAFMDIDNTSDRNLWWYVVIHVTFITSGLVLALSDRFSTESKSH